MRSLLRWNRAPKLHRADSRDPDSPHFRVHRRRHVHLPRDELNGPVTLHLWSSASGFAGMYAYLYDCTAGGASCTLMTAAFPSSLELSIP